MILDFTFILTNEGKLFVCGTNILGRLGIGTESDLKNFVEVQTEIPFISVSAGETPYVYKIFTKKRNFICTGLVGVQVRLMDVQLEKMVPFGFGAVWCTTLARWIGLNPWFQLMDRV